MNLFDTVLQQYQGYLNSPLLWQDHDLIGLKQMQLSHRDNKKFNRIIPKNLILGKRVEQFVINQLEESKDIEILLTNKQIQNGKITIGELDCLLKQNGFPIHLEIVYKFYLYDPMVGATEIEHWIGPNRRDTLCKKLSKLKEKQLPLLFNEYTKAILNNLALNVNDIEQRVLFKAQLFTPYRTSVTFESLNQECLVGFYVHHSELEQFSMCKFYIPKKVDWVIDPNNEVELLSFKEFKQSISELISYSKSPLCWIKFPNGTLKKFFVVWW